MAREKGHILLYLLCWNNETRVTVKYMELKYRQEKGLWSDFNASFMRKKKVAISVKVQNDS